jgi:putative aldouronate transport system permease protein
MNDPSKYPLQSYLYVMLESSDPAKLAGSSGTLTPEQIEALKNIGGKNIQAAQIFLGMLPITLVYPFVQRFFIKGITIGSVKG